MPARRAKGHFDDWKYGDLASSAGCSSYRRLLHMLLQAQPWKAEGEPLVAGIHGSRSRGRWTWCAGLLHLILCPSFSSVATMLHGEQRDLEDVKLTILGGAYSGTKRVGVYIYTSMYYVLGCWIPMHGKDRAYKSRYNNGLIAKLMLMWRREGRREMRAWLSCKHQAGHGSIGISGPK
jgi:uncharacterized membrane protein (GlpM family)